KKKAPAKVDRFKGIELLSDATLLEDAQLKKALMKSRKEAHKLQASCSSEGADFELEVPDESKAKSSNTNEGTGVKPRVLDKTEGSKQSSFVSSDFASKFLILDNVPPVFNEVASIMNVKVRQKESSTQASPLLLVPVTAISETSTVPATTIPLTIQHQQSTPTPKPTTKPSLTLIPTLPDFSSLFRFDHKVSTLETELSQLKQVDHSTQILTSIRS
nr:hypothetical protein [Tanacetum cinerariifolium]